MLWSIEERFFLESVCQPKQFSCVKQAGSDGLELAFDTQELRKLCVDEDCARRALGSEVAGQLKHRLADISAASRVTDLVAGSPQIEGTQLTIHLRNEIALVCIPNHPGFNLKAFAESEWERVYRLKVIMIGKPR